MKNLFLQYDRICSTLSPHRFALAAHTCPKHSLGKLVTAKNSVGIPMETPKSENTFKITLAKIQGDTTHTSFDLLWLYSKLYLKSKRIFPIWGLYDVDYPCQFLSKRNHLSLFLLPIQDGGVVFFESSKTILQFRLLFLEILVLLKELVSVCTSLPASLVNESFLSPTR